MKVKNLDKLTPTRRVAFTLTDIVAEQGDGKSVVLLLEHAGDRNAGWRNAVDRLAVRGASTGSVDGEDWIRERIPAFARYVVKDWQHAFDETGKAEPYTAERGEKLLTELVDNGGMDLVGAVMRFSFNPQNFRDLLDEGAAERVGNG